MAVTDWGGAYSRFLGLASVGEAQSLDHTALRPYVTKRICQIDVKYITHMQSVLAKMEMYTKKGIHKVQKLDCSAQNDIYIYMKHIKNVPTTPASRLW